MKEEDKIMDDLEKVTRLFNLKDTNFLTDLNEEDLENISDLLNFSIKREPLHFLVEELPMDIFTFKKTIKNINILYKAKIDIYRQFGQVHYFNNVGDDTYILRVKDKEILKRERNKIRNFILDTQNLNVYLTFKDNIFYYHNRPLSINKNERLYQVLNCIFDITKGKTIIFEIEELVQKMKKLYPEDFIDKDFMFIEGVIRGTILERDKGLLRKIKKNKETNGEFLFSSIKIGKIKFNNEKNI